MPTSTTGVKIAGPWQRASRWSYTLVMGLALAVSLMVGVFHLSPFGARGFFYFIATAACGVLLAHAITSRLIVPAWLRLPRTLRFCLFGAPVVSTAILCLLMSAETPIGSAWRWGVGPQVGLPVAVRDRVSWGQAVPSVFEFNVSSWPGLSDPEWAWQMTTDLPGRLGTAPGRIEFLVTQPEDEVLNMNVGRPWDQYRGSDGIALVFKAKRGETWQTVHRFTMNLHTAPGQRRWHTVQVDLPASVPSLAIEVDSGGNHLGDKVYVTVAHVSVRVLGLWLDVMRLVRLANVLSIFWLTLVVSSAAVAGLEMLTVSQASRLPSAGSPEPRLLVWLIVAIPIFGVAWIGTSQLLGLLGWHRATWIGVRVNAQDPSLPPPFIYVNHTAEAGDFSPVTWYGWKAAQTPIGIRPLDNTRGLKVLAIEDQQEGVIPPASWRLPPSGMTLLDDRQTLRVTDPGVLWLPNSHSRGPLTVVLEAGPGAGRVELDWLDQKRVFDLSVPTRTTYRAALPASAAYQGWFLLPPREITTISVKVGRRESAYALRDLTIYDDANQAWTGSALAAGVTSTANCRPTRSATELLVEKDPGTDCTFVIPNLRPINVVRVYVRLLLCALLATAGLASLWALSFLAGLVRRWERESGVVGSGPIAWLRTRAANWSVGNVAMAVGSATVAFQLVYFVVVPIGYINDTHGYYSLARDYLRLPSLYAIDPNRTPGYPIFVAATIWLFGDQMEGIVLAQHMVLAMLGPLTVWFLSSRTGPLVAALGGLLVGMGPTTSLLANTVATESLFASICYIALICLIHGQSRPTGVFLAGLLAGLATLIRPNGILLPAVMLAWLFLRWWCGQDRIASLQRLAFTGVGITLGYLLIISPWLRAEHGMTGQWELDHRSSFTLWLNSVIEGRSPASLAINRPASIIFSSSPLSKACDDVEGWRLHSDLAQARYIDWPTINATDSEFFAESVREGLRQNPRRFLQFFVGTFNYSLLHIVPSPGSPLCAVENAKSEIYYGRFTYPLPVQTTVSDAKDIVPFLRQLSYRWHPPQSRLRAAMLWVTQAGIDAWMIAGGLAFCGVAACLMLAPLRDLALLWLYWLVSVTLLGVMGWPTDRYMFVCEPFVYSLATVMVFALLSARARATVLDVSAT